jgi:putative ABC transport system permease protein
MALGASRGDILKLVLGSGLRLISVGTIAGILAALGVSRFLSSLLFSIGPHDPVTFAFATFLLLPVAFAAMLIPAAFATKVNPIVALRCD